MLQALADEANPHARTPWILCQRIQDWDQDIRKRKAALEQAGARIIEHDMPGGQYMINLVVITFVTHFSLVYRPYGFESASQPVAFSRYPFCHGRRGSVHHRSVRNDYLPRRSGAASSVGRLRHRHSCPYGYRQGRGRLRFRTRSASHQSFLQRKIFREIWKG